MKQIFFAALFTVAFGYVKAQTVVLDRVIARDTVRNNTWGPNGRHHIGLFIGLDMYAGMDQDGFKGVFNNSLGGNFGVRYKYQYNRFLANVLELHWNLESFGFERKSGNNFFPDPGNYNHEAFQFGNIGLGGFFRFNYGKRGYTLGKYVDLGASADWVASNIYYTADRDADGDLVDVRHYQKEFVRDFKSDAIIRLGFNHFALVARYRYTDYFKTTAKYTVVYEVPRLRAGVELAF